MIVGLESNLTHLGNENKIEFNLPDMPCMSVDVMIGVLAFISSVCVGFCCSVRCLESTALHGVYPDDTAG